MCLVLGTNAVPWDLQGLNQGILESSGANGGGKSGEASGPETWNSTGPVPGTCPEGQEWPRIRCASDTFSAAQPIASILEAGTIGMHQLNSLKEKIY